MAYIIDGKKISTEMKDELKEKVAAMKQDGVEITLAVIQVGNDPASTVYVGNKKKACEYIGIQSLAYELPEETTEKELLDLVEELNQRADVNGILVQLPLPKHIDENKVINTISAKKDVDGFHPLNVASLWQKQPCLLPCTPQGIIMMLEEAGVEIEGKKAVVIGRSNIVGLPASKLLLDHNATVTMAHSHTKNLAEVTRQADILVVAIGKPKFVTAEMVKPGAAVMDVGVNRNPETGKLCGDVDFDNVKDVASVITPVPGGLGPMTRACLMVNTLECFLRKMNKA